MGSPFKPSWIGCQCGSREKYLGVGAMPPKKSHAESGRIEWGMEWAAPPQPIRRCGGHHAPAGGPEQSHGWKLNSAYFEGHRTLLFAPMCRCFEFVKQYLMSQLGSKAEVWGQLPPCPNVETHLVGVQIPRYVTLYF